MNLGEEGDRQRVNGGNIENRQTERIFSSEPFGPFRGVALDVCVEFGGGNDVTMHGGGKGAPSRQPIRCDTTQSSLWPRLIFGLEPAAGLVPVPNDRGTAPPRPPLLTGFLVSLAVMSMDLHFPVVPGKLGGNVDGESLSFDNFFLWLRDSSLQVECLAEGPTWRRKGRPERAKKGAWGRRARWPRERFDRHLCIIAPLLSIRLTDNTTESVISWSVSLSDSGSRVVPALGQPCVLTKVRHDKIFSPSNIGQANAAQPDPKRSPCLVCFIPAESIPHGGFLPAL